MAVGDGRKSITLTAEKPPGYARGFAAGIPDWRGGERWLMSTRMMRDYALIPSTLRPGHYRRDARRGAGGGDGVRSASDSNIL